MSQIILKNILQQAKIKLSTISSTPKLDVELLLAKALNVDRTYIFSHPEYQLSSEKIAIFESLIKRRLAGEPIAYILGKREFWSLEFQVNKDVLIPRPETELLVELALEFFKDKKSEQITIADFGTGSGAIALSIAHECPNWQIIATDNSEKALQVAKYNAQKLNIKNVEFYLGDWCDALVSNPDNLQSKGFDAIISNPPYGAKNDQYFTIGDVRFEPQNALVAGEDGLEAYRKIIPQAYNKLKEQGILLLEHGYDQKDAITDLLAQNNFSQIKNFKDLAGIDRVVTGIK